MTFFAFFLEVKYPPKVLAPPFLPVIEWSSFSSSFVWAGMVTGFWSQRIGSHVWQSGHVCSSTYAQYISWRGKRHNESHSLHLSDKMWLWLGSRCYCIDVCGMSPHHKAITVKYSRQLCMSSKFDLHNISTMSMQCHLPHGAQLTIQFLTPKKE